MFGFANQRNKYILSRTTHRPFPLPGKKWVQQQTWEDLLFSHWSVEPGVIRMLLPQHLSIDTFQGKAWLTISPFKMRNVRLRMFPPVPTTYNFLEMNVRTYVTLNGQPGIYFFSMDASSLLTVLGARSGSLLPYFYANMKMSQGKDQFTFHTDRYSLTEPMRLSIVFHPTSSESESKAGSLDEWLTERYCYFTPLKKDSFIRTNIHHLKWKLHQAEAIYSFKSLPRKLEHLLYGNFPVSHFSKSQHVLIWSPEIVRA